MKNHNQLYDAFFAGLQTQYLSQSYCQKIVLVLVLVSAKTLPADWWSRDIDLKIRLGLGY